MSTWLAFTGMAAPEEWGGVAGWECARPVQLRLLLLHGSSDSGQAGAALACL